MTTVLMISPGYPLEMPFFARGLAATGATVLGLGDSPPTALPPMAREALSGYLQVGQLWDEPAVLAQVRSWPAARGVDRVECLWEPGMILAAHLREGLGLPGMTVEETVPFRDKETMKQRLDRAGIRTPRHRRARSASEVRAAASEIGYPVIVKPIAGAGSADTHRVDDAGALEEVLRLTGHVPEVSVEEFVEAEEFTFDTICAGGRILYHNVSWYRPRPLVARQNEWVSSQTIALRDPGDPYVAGGVAMGPKVLEALGFRDGFTHMEWFRRPDGEAVFGEIAARPPGARSTEIMNYACDADVWRAWAEAVVHGRIERPIERKYNAGIVFKRARGEGVIRKVEGVERLLADFGPAVVSVELLPVGAPRRNWKQTLLSDGWIVVRHPDLQETLRMCDRVANEVHLHAGRA